VALCLAAFGILLWCSAVGAGSFQNPPAASKRNQKPAATTSTSGGLTEEFTFLIKDFKIDHQGENNQLNITISYRYKAHLSNEDYPDFTLIAGDIKTLLTNYPNEEDYWEIVNKKITSMVLNKYPTLTRITSQLEVSPSRNDPYLRSSIVTRDRAMMRRVFTRQQHADKFWRSVRERNHRL
jgi:hypothetical protein